MISYAKTDTGLVRRSNQDFLFAADQPVGPLPNLFIVADGMGGHKAGDFASRYVVEHMKEYIENSDLASPVMILRKALEKTNQGLFEEAQGNPDREGMGSTLVAATIEDDMMYVANVGDSRLYLLRDSLAQITRDHSLVEEMVAANMAPGMNREFLSEDWKHLIPRKCLYDAMDEANDLVDLSVQTDIQGYDIDGDIVRAARANAKAAGVDELIHFQQRSVSDLSHPKKYGFLITNPPYGERIEDKKNLPELYKTIGERFAELDSWSAYIITAYEDTERYFGRKADKNRKIYNGMMKTYFYQFLGPKPPRKREDRREER